MWYIGVNAKSCIVEARGSVARMINVDPSGIFIRTLRSIFLKPISMFADIIFTSGGTEVTLIS